MNCLAQSEKCIYSGYTIYNSFADLNRQIQRTGDVSEVKSVKSFGSAEALHETGWFSKTQWK